MPRAEKGSKRNLKSWLSSSKPRTDDEVDLVQVVGGEHTTLTTWACGDIEKMPEWENHVFTLAQENADERGQTTAFLVRHRRGDAHRGQYELRCKAETTDDADSFDGSSHSLVLGLYKQNEKLLTHVLNQTNSAVLPLMKALESAHARVKQLEDERYQLTDLIAKHRREVNEAIDRAQKAESETDEKFEERITKLIQMGKMLMGS